jgi:hypothetical protein
MKKFVLFLVVILYSVIAFIIQHANAQIPEFKCGTMEYLEQQKKSNPALESKMLLQEQQIQQWVKEIYSPNTNEVITIPVVVHIVYNTDEQNVSDQRVFEQIEMTNRDYAGLRTQSMGAFSDTLKSNTGIQFCLAQRKPDGTPTNGIERRYTTDTSFTGNNNVKFDNTGGMDAWDPTKYLNIWVCKILGFTGLAQFPHTGEKATFGAMVHYLAFGKTGAIPSVNNGGVTTHEIGHCLFLYHIWGDDKGACTGTDYISDTPNQASPTLGFHEGILTDSCTSSSPGIMYMNFMDYSDDSTWANFTPKQTIRMRAMFEPPYGYLVSLANSDACSPPSSVESKSNLKSFDLNIYPNPAKEQVSINFTINELNIVTLNITNSLGIVIAKISNNLLQEPGNYRINYDAGILAPGVYYLTMKAGNFIETKKFVVIR